MPQAMNEAPYLMSPPELNVLSHAHTHPCTHTLHNTQQCTVASIEMMKTHQFVVRSQIGNKHFYVANRHFPVSCGDTT